MYEDAWYSFVPEIQHKRGASQNLGHRRRESLLQQPNGANQPADVVVPLDELYEEDQEANSPPEATLARRSKSYSDFDDIVKAQRTKDAAKTKRRKRKDTALEALVISGAELGLGQHGDPIPLESCKEDLLEASQQEYLLYQDQLEMTERHLERLIGDTNGALDLLSSLAESFRAVEDQTTSFQSRCDDLLSEQRRLQKLADEVGTDLHFYEYLDNVSRRLNAPGASRLVDDDAFGEILMNLESCIAFMTKHPSYRDAESYLARYQSLLTKALHLLEVGFNSRLDRVSSEISKQIAATQSESARHALAYGRFEELLLESYSLIPNVQRVIYKAYDQFGNPGSGQNFEIYVNTANNLFQAYLGARDRDLRPVVQTDVDAFKTEAKSASVETASRNFVKQCFERSYNESTLFTKVFAIEPLYSSDEDSAFAALKSHRSDLVNGTNITPVATNLQSVLAPADLETICNVLGWITNEYLLLDYDEDETPFVRHSREMTARLLTEHLWAFADSRFDAEITKSISKAPVALDALRIGPVVNGVASSNAYPPVKRALDLLIMFDRSMPKERCQRDSPVIFKIVKESIQALQRAEARIKSSKNGTDPDLFMIKNLLILKNELLSLEIGDIRSQGAAMQHFGQIWDALSLAQDWVGYFSSFIPGSSLWSRGLSPAATASSSAKKISADQDASEQLDEMLRQSIYGFTQRWAALINDATGRKLGGKNLAKIERDLDDLLQNAFSNQPEVVVKLKEAIQINAQAQNEQKGSKSGSRV